MNPAYVPINTDFPELPIHNTTPVRELELDFANLGNVLLPSPILNIESYTSQLADADEALAWFDLQMKLLIYKRARILVSKNRCLPVSKLPEGVFRMIFRYLAPNSPAPDTLPSGWMRKQLGFSQVCHVWRRIALADPQLWCRPPLRFLNLAKEFIVRADEYPLDFYANFNTISHSARAAQLKDSGAVELAFKHGRFRTFDVYEISKELIYQHFPNISFSTLEHLRMIMPANDPDNAIDFPMLITPRLQRITIENFVYPLQIQPLKKLTHLHLKSFGYKTPTILSVDTLLKIIAEAPNLTFIKMEGALHPDLGNSPIGPRIPLTQLKSLQLTEGAAAVFRFLAEIETPMLKGPDYSPARISWQQMWINEWIRDLPRVSLADSPPALNAHDSKMGQGIEKDHFYISLGLSFKETPEYNGSFLSQIQSHLSLNEIRVMEAESLNDWEVPSSLPSLTEITIKSYARGFIRALRGLTAGHPSSQQVFPQLSVIKMLGVSLENDCTEEGTDIVEFMRTLGRCREMGVPLQTIVLKDCWNADKYTKTIKPILEEYGISLSSM